MNNIDILEELVNGFDNLISYKQKQAIETLIAENKELNSENVRIRATLNEVTKDYILKSKVEEEIQELKNMKIDGEVFKTAVNYAIKILQSLLGKE